MCEYQQTTNSQLMLCKDGGLCTMCVLGNYDKYNIIYAEDHPVYNRRKNETDSRI